jgi:hypothetical protein
MGTVGVVAQVETAPRWVHELRHRARLALEAVLLLGSAENCRSMTLGRRPGRGVMSVTHDTRAPCPAGGRCRTCRCSRGLGADGTSGGDAGFAQVFGSGGPGIKVARGCQERRYTESFGSPAPRWPRGLPVPPPGGPPRRRDRGRPRACGSGPTRRGRARKTGRGPARRGAVASSPSRRSARNRGVSIATWTTCRPMGAVLLEKAQRRVPPSRPRGQSPSLGRYGVY